MKKIIIIISHRKLKLGLVFSTLLALFIIILCSLPTDILSVFNTLSDGTIEELEKEQERLKGVLTHSLPNTDKPLYETQRKSGFYHEPTTETLPINHVISDGDPLAFRIVTDAPDYLRPIYDSDWRGFYFRNWLYLPNRIRDAQHKLFIFYGGASNLFDFGGEQSLNFITDTDYHKDINFLIYDFNVQEIKYYKNQIVLIGEPQITGAQVIAVSVNDVLPKEIDKKDFLFQLATPMGYEIGWAYVPQKICEALHNIFIIPSDDDGQKNLLGNLAFFEKFHPLHESQVGFLVYNLEITGVKIFENKVFIIGTPSRTGVQMISIDKKYLDKNQEYIFYLETLDGFQIDVVTSS